MKRCKNCHKWFKIKRPNGRPQIFCSHKCCSSYWSKCNDIKYHPRVNYKKKRCKFCNKWFKPNRKDKQCCCKNCYEKFCKQRTRIINKSKAFKYKGNKCEKCGYNKCLTSLEFHHRNPRYKEIPIAENYNRSWSKLKNELDKCSLLCANCHREVHATRVKR